jgi:hypothetical protein
LQSPYFIFYLFFLSLCESCFFDFCLSKSLGMGHVFCVRLILLLGFICTKFLSFSVGFVSMMCSTVVQIECTVPLNVISTSSFGILHCMARGAACVTEYHSALQLVVPY